MPSNGPPKPTKSCSIKSTPNAHAGIAKLFGNLTPQRSPVSSREAKFHWQVTFQISKTHTRHHTFRPITPSSRRFPPITTPTRSPPRLKKPSSNAVIEKFASVPLRREENLHLGTSTCMSTHGDCHCTCLTMRHT